MRDAWRYLAALLAVIFLLTAAALGLFGCVTTEFFAREVNGTSRLRAMQQQRIDGAAAELNERWGLAEDVLQPWTENAAAKQAQAMAAWWGALWTDPTADAALPLWLTAEDEGILVADVRGDEGFIARTDAAQRRAIARDEVAYQLDLAVCRAVTPLRYSIVDLAVGLAQDVLPLPMLRTAAIAAAAVLTVLALVLLLIAHKAAGSALAATGLAMAALSVPVWLADVPGMLAELSDIAALQGVNALRLLAIFWYGAAALLLALGWIIIGVKGFFRRDEA